MKLIILFLVIATLHVSANSYGQNISLHVKGESFKSILTKIRKQSGKDFLYNSQQIDEDRKMNLSISNKPLAETLRILLADQQLTYSVRNNAILIHPNASSSTTAAKNNTLQQDLQGKLKDHTGKPIAGATILLVGTGQSVATDEGGNFQFAKTPPSGELRINFIGFKEKTISFQRSQQLDITLDPEINEMEEVVVVGYGVQKKSDLTGSISAVQAKDFTQGANINALQLINGKAPGVTISQTNSAPGAGTKIQVRGAGSINSSNDALIVVDGLPGVDPRSLSPDDIESIDILKDASAAAIYGTRAASGVVLITTKKGKSGIAIAKYDSYIGFQNVAKKLDVLNGKQYMHVLNAIRKDGNKDAIFTEEQINSMEEGTNWQCKLP